MKFRIKEISTKSYTHFIVEYKTYWFCAWTNYFKASEWNSCPKKEFFDTLEEANKEKNELNDLYNSNEKETIKIYY